MPPGYIWIALLRILTVFLGITLIFVTFPLLSVIFVLWAMYAPRILVSLLGVVFQLLALLVNSIRQGPNWISKDLPAPTLPEGIPVDFEYGSSAGRGPFVQTPLGP